MNTTKTPCLVARLAAAALLALPLAATADVPGYYAGVHGGVNDLDDWPHRANFGAGVSTSGSLGTDSKQHWGLVAGMQSPELRLEAELAFGRFGITSTTLGPVSAPVSATGHYWTLMGNAYRSFQLNQQANLYVGAGIGYAHTKLPALPALAGCACYGEASDSGLAVQLRAGAEHNFGDGHRLFLQYTLLRLPGAGSDGTPSVSYKHKNVSAVTVGYRRTF